MEYFVKKIKETITVETVILRLVMAWILTASIYNLSGSGTFLSAEFIVDFNLIIYAVYILLFFIIFTVAGIFKNYSKVEVFGPTILMTLYGYITTDRNSSIYYTIMLCIMILISLVYAVSRTDSLPKLKSKKAVILVYIIAALVYIVIAGGITVLRVLTYRAPAFDLGIWTQMFYYMKETFQPFTTVERDTFLSHFAIHFSPVYYIYFPFYLIFQSAVTLQVLQVLTLISGIIPVYLLCKHFGLGKMATAMFGVLFAFFPALATGCFYDLHENCFLVPFMLWLFYFIEKDNNIGMVVFALLTMLTKEDAPVYVACIGLFMMLSKKKYFKGAVMTMGSILYFLIVVMLLEKYGYGIMSYRYNNYSVAGSSGGLMDVIKNFIANPAYVMSESMSEEKLDYSLKMLLPLGLLPIMSRKISRLILFIPMLIVNLATAYKYQYSMFFQYVFGVLAILFYLAIMNYSELDTKKRHFMGILALCMTIVIIPATTLSRTYYLDVYRSSSETIDALNEMTDSIPKEASVAASSFFTTHLADRDELYEYPSDNFSEYIILDLRFDSYEEEELTAIIDSGYVLEKSVDNLYLLYHYVK